jgi:small conductance mechanosensitive channel
MNAEEFYQKAYDGMLNHGPKILFALIVFLAGQWVIRVCRKWIQRSLHRREINSSLRPFMQSLVITGLQVLLLLMVMQIVGVQMTMFAAAIASLGVAVGLALSGTLQNFASGVLILLLKPFKVGDNVVAQGQDGIVTSIELFYTVVTTFDNKAVIIPNSKLSNEVIVNISKEGRRRLDIELKFAHAFDMQQVQNVILRSVADCQEVMKEPAPSAGISAIEPDGFKVMVQVWVDALDYSNIRLIVNQKLLNDIKISGVKLPGMI